MHCGRFVQPMTRRQMLCTAAGGFGAAAFSGMLAEASVDELAGERSIDVDRPPRPHSVPRAKSVIFLYMDGGVSQVDSFDPKPALEKFNGEDPAKAIGRLDQTQFGNVGKVLRSPWKFRRYGQSGLHVSELFPHVARHADELCVIRSMTSQFALHTSANYLLHTGSGLQGRPSMGAWVGYALGTENKDLPGFVVLNGGLIPPGGRDNFNAGFLPAALQASVFNAEGTPVADVSPSLKPPRQRRLLDLSAAMDRRFAASVRDRAVDAAVANAETAFRMQASVPKLLDLSGETAETHTLYGLDAPAKRTQIFGRQCLLARRMVERGVRFIELTCPGSYGDRWDQHSGLKRGHEENAEAVDRPIAGLLSDLKRRGILDDTLVIWAGEFGRTPFAQGKDGRDHNPSAFTVWMAGGGSRPATVYGRTDDFGYRVVEGRMDIHDLHATMLHLMGVDHERATVRHSGRDMRLTDVHGRVMEDLIA